MERWHSLGPILPATLFRFVGEEVVESGFELDGHPYPELLVAEGHPFPVDADLPPSRCGSSAVNSVVRSSGIEFTIRPRASQPAA